MGWKEDKGLGKQETGLVNHIKVSKREQGLGLGMDKLQDNAGILGWNNTASTFDALLQNLNQVYNNLDSDIDSQIDSEEGKKIRKKNKDKKKKKKDNKRDKDDTNKRKRETPMISVGIKYKKLSSSKDLSTKSLADMTAVLGININR
eukprot:gene20121-26127_t